MFLHLSVQTRYVSSHTSTVGITPSRHPRGIPSAYILKMMRSRSKYQPRGPHLPVLCSRVPCHQNWTQFCCFHKKSFHIFIRHALKRHRCSSHISNYTLTVGITPSRHPPAIPSGYTQDAALSVEISTTRPTPILCTRVLVMSPKPGTQFCSHKSFQIFIRHASSDSSYSHASSLYQVFWYI